MRHHAQEALAAGLGAEELGEAGEAVAGGAVTAHLAHEERQPVRLEVLRPELHVGDPVVLEGAPGEVHRPGDVEQQLLVGRVARDGALELEGAQLPRVHHAQAARRAGDGRRIYRDRRELLGELPVRVVPDDRAAALVVLERRGEPVPQLPFDVDLRHTYFTFAMTSANFA